MGTAPQSSGANTLMDFSWWPHTLDTRVASYRIRCAQIVKYLQEHGSNCDVWQPGKPVPRVLILSKRYDSESVEVALNLRARFGTKLILDLCDNHFYSEDSHPRWQLRAETLRRAVENMDLVIASSTTLADILKKECTSAPRVLVIADAVEMPNFEVPWTPKGYLARLRLRNFRMRLQKTAIEKSRRIVWFGNHASSYADGGMSDLVTIREILETAHRRSPLMLTVVSNNFQTFKNVLSGWKLATEYLPWQAENFSSILSLHSICVIPIRLNPFTLCKTNNRAATALLHNLAVVADAIPSYRELEAYISLNNWLAGLDSALNNQEMVVECISRGKNYIRDNFSLAGISPLWVNAIEQVR